MEFPSGKYRYWNNIEFMDGERERNLSTWVAWSTVARQDGAETCRHQSPPGILSLLDLSCVGVVIEVGVLNVIC